MNATTWDPLCIVPVRTIGPNAREHWAARAARVKSERAMTAVLLRTSGPRPALPCAIRFVRQSSGALDDDNLRGACKALRDEVAAWLGVDDRAGTGVTWEYAQEKAPRGTIGVRIEVERVSGAE